MSKINPSILYPLPQISSDMVFLNNFISTPNIQIGDFTYYHDFNNAELFEKKNVIYHNPAINDKLIIGKFCQIAMGTKFLMNGAMHLYEGFSTYPFGIFCKEWAEASQTSMPFPNRGDTIVGNDVWFGMESVILPGIKIGNGAIIGTRSLVTKDVPAYTIVAGSPAKILRKRFDDTTIEELEKIQWWNWPLEKITENLLAILGSDIEKLKAVQ